MKKSVIYVLISTLMFSSMEIALKVAGSEFNPIQLNLLRFFIGGVVLLPFAFYELHKRRRKLNLDDWKAFAFTGFACVVISMTLYQLAIVYDKPAIVAVLFSCNPVFAVIFAYFILHERIGRANLISLIISVIGLIVIVNPFNLTNPVGIILSLLSAVTFGFYSILSQSCSVKRNLDGITITCFTFIAGSFELFVLSLITNIPAVASGMKTVGWLSQFAAIPILKDVNLQNFWILFFIGVCVTGGGFAFYFLAMQESGVSIASLVFFIKPGLAPILAMIFVGEKINLPTVVGIVIILIGSVVTFIGERYKETDATMLNDKTIEESK
ncbi:DMT family transporter [Fructilactobacillus fructivorans]|uniref:Permease of the drug/metabolite transporter (DMT) superfamily n=1 Tax=Fructilactobacillus fructivorans TaxID=1614 RepID=A0A0C1M685_9LACO|nr:DMT family transporter [Fructilactobacillus fructivorans]KID41724.1 Permease of the drug/metabolite transporter (DMT) superfamily [Fructilactobacillus fructivorans]MCT0151377.1 EamA family transporter [Fructilactobacillus fructivorans]MCT2867546.1 EamA family transporter [Fructilactobacillus fructivorans]MCT2868936.1 EamA family transporter [Fructilactobacillus fructivorans]MCT2873894.1 EamA family transporter [Fructilactobacillus fructivorans]